MRVERRHPGKNPPYYFPEYRSSVLRAPAHALVRIPYGPTELSGPSAAALVRGRGAGDAYDLTRRGSAGEALGERIIVHGRVLDAAARPLPGVLVEIWQANAAGRYAHEVDQHPAPLDPNFTGAGFCLTDDAGRYRFVTIKPGAYPWKNHPNAWRPAHVHFSIVGRAFSQRLVTQMYFPGDPLQEHDPIFRAVPEAARSRLVSRFDLAQTVPEWALAYEFDVTLGGREGTPAS
jgi:protocatechuate 3,4-dioxygenase, beta subunit